MVPQLVPQYCNFVAENVRSHYLPELLEFLGFFRGTPFPAYNTYLTAFPNLTNTLAASYFLAERKIMMQEWADYLDGIKKN